MQTKPADASSSRSVCGQDTLDELLGSCCQNEEFFSIKNQSVSGRLPASFMPARNWTDLSLNPGLCGPIKQLPARVTASTVEDTSPPLLLQGSGVQLDLKSVGKQGPWVGVLVAYWLGFETAIDLKNLVRALPNDIAYSSCVLLRHGRFKVAARKYCNPADAMNCSCGSSRFQAISTFRSQEAWDACHSVALDLEFTTSGQKDVAIAQYDAHMRKVDRASTCGEDGVHYRCRIAVKVWGIGIGVCAVLLSIAVFTPIAFWYRLAEAFGKAIGQAWRGVLRRVGVRLQESGRRPMDWTVLEVLFYHAVHAWDMYGDYSFLMSAAKTGNLRIVLVLGWLLVVPYFVSSWTFICLNMLGHKNCYKIITGGSTKQTRPHQPFEWLRSGINAFLVLLKLLTSVVVVFAALLSINLAAFTTVTEVSPDEYIVLAYLLLFSGLSLQISQCLFGAFYKWAEPDKWVETITNFGDFRMVFGTVLVADGLFLVCESIPQAVLQSYWWVNGEALVANWLFVVSTSGSCVSIFVAFAAFAMIRKKHMYMAKVVEEPTRRV